MTKKEIVAAVLGLFFTLNVVIAGAGGLGGFLIQAGYANGLEACGLPITAYPWPLWQLWLWKTCMVISAVMFYGAILIMLVAKLVYKFRRQEQPAN